MWGGRADAMRCTGRARGRRDGGATCSSRRSILTNSVTASRHAALPPTEVAASEADAEEEEAEAERASGNSDASNEAPRAQRWKQAREYLEHQELVNLSKLKYEKYRIKVILI